MLMCPKTANVDPKPKTTNPTNSKPAPLAAESLMLYVTSQGYLTINASWAECLAVLFRHCESPKSKMID